MKRNATAVWNGTGKDGKGHLTTQSTVLNKTQYSFGSRFENGVGTNPEELIASPAPTRALNTCINHGGGWLIMAKMPINKDSLTKPIATRLVGTLKNARVRFHQRVRQVPFAVLVDNLL